jgi:hypothetical protein
MKVEMATRPQTDEMIIQRSKVAMPRIQYRQTSHNDIRLAGARWPLGLTYWAVRRYRPPHMSMETQHCVCKVSPCG